MNKILILLLISAPLCAMKNKKPFRRIPAWTHKEYERTREEMLKDAIMMKLTKNGIRDKKIEDKKSSANGQ